jgi:hypothetical protein
MTMQPDSGGLWCGNAFLPRATGGKRQVFCRPACRRAFDAAGRRRVAAALPDKLFDRIDPLDGGPLSPCPRSGAAAARLEDPMTP